MSNRQQLATEYPEPNEERHIAIMVDVMRKSLEKAYKPGETLRRFHPKNIALVKAELTVEPNLPEHLRKGLFREPRTYNALIRFSNAPAKVTADHKKSARGMAIKVLNTGFDPLDSDPSGQTQDVVLTTNKVLVPGTLKKYMRSARGLFGSVFHLVGFVLNPLNLGTLLTIQRGMKQVTNLLEESYFSSTPYLFGDGLAVKWHARPHKAANSSLPQNAHDDFLRHRLQADLVAQAHRFDLCIQPQENVSTEPIEDSGREWKTPFTKVATITLLQQQHNHEATKEQAEKMTFSPWHCLPAHRPLGGNNRARRKVYGELFRFRTERNA